ncbi:nitroreductase [Ammoniphilus oxalaticus]|uniref:Putative NAD(P)H nitroreductase n=1 Tax=Ammoniphilus oxalaticus TaxID=66863 RepID=A0A419SGK8_9BACL|nr:nitroreductase [Ammoniphilus oxalaticus]RKD22932.1 nitroreductase [Ammoniphilus oxalaticus]
MSTISTVITERRSIKRFKADPISEDTILNLLNTAAWAPNHGLREPWRFILFMGEGREKLARTLIDNPIKGPKKKSPEAIRENILRIPIHLLIVMQEDPRQKEWEEDFAAVSAFIQNLQLAAWEQKIGSIWKTGPYIYSPYVREQFGIKPGEKFVAHLQMGYPEALPEARPRTPIENKIDIIK